MDNNIVDGDFEIFEGVSDQEYENLKYSFKDYENEANKVSDVGLTLTELLDTDIDCVVFDRKDMGKVAEALIEAGVKFNPNIGCANATVISRINENADNIADDIRPEAKLYAYREATELNYDPLDDLYNCVWDSMENWNEFHKKLKEGDLDVK